MSFVRIKQLPDDVVNKIAAGEVIQRPQNAVKELIENSLDAGAKNIQVTVKIQGSDFKMIQVKDDGCGIRGEDLKLACERHCTSKLQSFEDLSQMQTFGFRGEALSSICQIARVDIISRTADCAVGYQIKNDAGDITPIAANIGTIVTARELFYNYSQRRNSLQSPAAEYNLIYEIVSLYALHNLPVAFTLTKYGAEPDLKAGPAVSLIERVRLVIGPKIASNLTAIQVSDPTLKYSATGAVGDLNSCLKTYRFVFFVNNRLVDCQPLKKSLETIYRNYLTKGSCAFVLISLTIESGNLDVNVHPTKKEVRFLHETEIIEQIALQLETVLTQTKLSNKVTSGSKTQLDTSIASMRLNGPEARGSNAKSSPTTPRQNTLVREDHSIQKIDDSFRRQKARNDVGQQGIRRSFKLTSLLELKAAVIHACDAKLKTIFAESSLVGCVDGDGVIALIQYQTYLLQVDLSLVTEELFYYLTLCLFGNMSEMLVEPTISLKEMLQLAVSRTNRPEISAARMDEAIEQITIRKEMLFDYFSMRIDEEGRICTFPILINGYVPDWKKLPQFVYELAFQVNWVKEKQCFQTFSKALAQLNAVTVDSVDRDSISSLIYPEIKKRLRPSSGLQAAMSNLSNVPTLYRVFHRC